MSKLETDTLYHKLNRFLDKHSVQKYKKQIVKETKEKFITGGGNIQENEDTEVKEDKKKTVKPQEEIEDEFEDISEEEDDSESDDEGEGKGKQKKSKYQEKQEGSKKKRYVGEEGYLKSFRDKVNE